MKVALVCFRMDTPLSRVSSYSTELAAHLINHGIDVVRLASGSGGFSDVAYLRSTSDWNFTTKVSLRLRSFVQHEEVDLVHIIGGFPESGILRSLHVPIVYQFFGGNFGVSTQKHSMFQKIRGVIARYRISWLANRTIKSADHLIVHSEDAIGFLIKKYSVNRSNISLVPIATDDLTNQANTNSTDDRRSVLVLCDYYSKDMVLQALRALNRLIIEDSGVRFRLLCDFASYFAVLRTIKDEGMDALVDCIECRTVDDFQYESSESECVVIPQILLSRERLIAETRVIGTQVIHFAPSSVQNIKDSLGAEHIVSTFDEIVDYVTSKPFLGKKVYERNPYSWDKAVVPIVEVYSELIGRG